MKRLNLLHKSGELGVASLCSEFFPANIEFNNKHLEKRSKKPQNESFTIVFFSKRKISSHPTICGLPIFEILSLRKSPVVTLLCEISLTFESSALLRADWLYLIEDLSCFIDDLLCFEKDGSFLDSDD